MANFEVVDNGVVVTVMEFMVVVVMEEMEDEREVWETWREMREWHAKFGLWEMNHEVVIEGYYSITQWIMEKVI